MGDGCEHKCGGRCCQAFYLPYSPDELQERILELQDGRVIIGMVEHLGFFAGENLPIDHAFSQPPSNGGHFYRCNNLTAEGLCGIYATRPKMCRDYPYGGQCNYAGCEATCRATADTPPAALRG